VDRWWPVDWLAGRIDLEAAPPDRLTRRSDFICRVGARHWFNRLVLAALFGLTGAQATVDAAAAQITFAQANLKMLQMQRNKLTLTAPANGAILVRTIQSGEVALPGAALLTIGQIDSLSIVVYVPEDQYGHLQLGQTAQVKVDSFPGETFTATVSQIADQAEFTPRTVQTSEECATTAYGVKLSIDNADGKLKPGMPADVTWTK